MVGTYLLSLAVALTATVAAQPLGPVARLPILNGHVAPNGQTRAAVLAGGTFPGPLIAGNKGDTFNITVIDMLTNETMLTPTSVHFHGINQHHSNWADGAAFVTQCPLIWGEQFSHVFTVNDQAGTFWYHSHMGTQYCDGLRGPLVVYDPNDPHRALYDWDNDTTVITLSDWYNRAAIYQPPIVTADSILINGADGINTSPQVFMVKQGSSYRFRLVAMSCDPNFIFSIDNHPNLTIIEADGENTQAINVSSIQIYASQRYSFVLSAVQPIGNYWIRAQGSGATIPSNPWAYAILRYEGADEQYPIPTTNMSMSTNPLLESSLHPLDNPQAPSLNISNGDLDILFNFDFHRDPLDGRDKFYVNNTAFDVSQMSLPVLLQILHGNYRSDQLLPKGSVYALPRGKTIQIRMPGGVVGGGHPLHLHGHAFSVVRSAGNQTFNVDNPVRRDTVNIGGPGDQVTIRFRTDNPGPWFLHCHIDWHLDLGFAVVMAEAPQDVAKDAPPPPAWWDLCPKYNRALSRPSYLIDQY